MLVLPTTLTLITTNRCTSACENCCFACSPKNRELIPAVKMRELIDEAAGLGSIKVVVFTGGECFLLGRELDSLIARAASHNLATRCVTNAYWARTLNLARERVRKLSEHGLTEINFSTGQFHAQSVPIDSVINACLASVERGLRVVLNIDDFVGSTFPLERLSEHPVLREAAIGHALTIRKNLWIANDGPAHLAHREEHSVFQVRQPCDYCLQAPGVTPNQQLVACCGLRVLRIPELHLGSVADRPLSEVLRSREEDLILLWLHLEGPAAILEFVKSKQPDYALPAGQVHICEACDHLYHDAWAQSVILEHIDEVADNVRLLFHAKRELAAQDGSQR